MNYFLQRLREPSTWAGLSVFAAMFGVPMSTYQVVTQAVAGVAAAAAVFVPENK